MTSWLKKILVIFPVVVLTVFFLRDHYASDYKHVSNQRLFLFAISIVLLYAWIIIGSVKREQESFFQIGIQSSFYVYIFMVLTLTGYFILFREISVHDWWHKMIVRVERRDRVNLELFKVFKIYRITDRQVLGNLVMLLPLGIYLPILYKRISGFLTVSLVCMLFSITIELLQLITSYRSADIDDVFLNTIGASVGFIIYSIAVSAAKPVDKMSQVSATVP